MYLICGGALVTEDPAHPFFGDGAVLVDGESIAAVGNAAELISAYPNAERIDAHGGVIMPGFINAHTHFYSAFLRGYPAGQIGGHGLPDLLKSRSWRLDRALSFDDCILAAEYGAVEAARCGVTTVFDHHASADCASGVLSAMMGRTAKAGIRVCTCIEASRRCGGESCARAMKENAAFAEYCAAYPSDHIKAAFGLHAPFTLSDSDLAAASALNAGRTGFHIHVSESTDDAIISKYCFSALPVERLYKKGILGRQTILAHCVHTTDRELDIIRDTDTMIVNNPITNQFNAVGTARVSEMLKRGIAVGLGTDGCVCSMPEAARAFIAAQRMASGDPYFGAAEAKRMLFDNNREIASRYFGEGIGVLKAGAPADVVIMDYSPATRFDAETAAAHVLFCMSGRECIMTMCAGKPIYMNGHMLTIDEEKLRHSMRAASDALWKRIGSQQDPVWQLPVV